MTDDAGSFERYAGDFNGDGNRRTCPTWKRNNDFRRREQLKYASRLERVRVGNSRRRSVWTGDSISGKDEVLVFKEAIGYTVPWLLCDDASV